MLSIKDLTDAEFEILWQMYCDFRYCQISPEQLKAYELIGRVLEKEGQARGIIDDWGIEE